MPGSRQGSKKSKVQVAAHDSTVHDPVERAYRSELGWSENEARMI